MRTWSWSARCACCFGNSCWTLAQSEAQRSTSFLSTWFRITYLCTPDLHHPCLGRGTERAVHYTVLHSLSRLSRNVPFAHRQRRSFVAHMITVGTLSTPMEQLIIAQCPFICCTPSVHGTCRAGDGRRQLCTAAVQSQQQRRLVADHQWIACQSMCKTQHVVHSEICRNTRRFQPSGTLVLT